MSRDPVAFEGQAIDAASTLPDRLQRPSYGKPFAFLIAFLIFGGAINPAVTLYYFDAISYVLQLKSPWAYQVITLNVMSICMVLTGVSLLISSTRLGWRCALIFLGIALLFVLASPLLQRMKVPGLSWSAAMASALEQGPLCILGSFAFLLSVPRVKLLFPASSTPSSGHQEPSAIASSGRLFRSWIGLLLISLLIPVVQALNRFIDKLPARSLSLLWDLRRESLYPYAGEYIFAVTSVLLVGLLLWRRRWSTIQALITLLWLAPTSGVLWFVLSRYAYALPMPVDVVYPAGLSFDWFAAMAWTAYLLEAPQVHQLYPGCRRYRHLVAGVDVF